MNSPREPSSRVPEWVVTYGDIMSLLLTFFIMLAAMSEIKKDDNRYQAVVESLRQQFGYEATTWKIPGDAKSKNSTFQFLTNLGRSKREDQSEGGAKVETAVGERLRVQALRRGLNTIVGAAIHFDEDRAELPESGREVLEELAPALIGKPQKIEIRGHTTHKPVTDLTTARDHWDLAYQRCHNTMQFLIGQGIDPERIRLSSAGPYEPLNSELTPNARIRNARVEVVLWDEQVDDYSKEESGDPPVEQPQEGDL